AGAGAVDAGHGGQVFEGGLDGEDLVGGDGADPFGGGAAFVGGAVEDAGDAAVGDAGQLADALPADAVAHEHANVLADGFGVDEGLPAAVGDEPVAGGVVVGGALEAGGPSAAVLLDAGEVAVVGRLADGGGHGFSFRGWAVQAFQWAESPSLTSSSVAGPGSGSGSAGVGWARWAMRRHTQAARTPAQ